MQNTRLAPRVSIDMEIPSEIDKTEGQSSVLASGGLKVRAFDISKSGMGIAVNYLLPKGLIIKLKIGGGPFGLKNDMELKGEITHCKYIKLHEYKCGVKFIDVPAEYDKAISSFIATYEKRESPRLDLPQ